VKALLRFVFDQKCRTG